MAVFSDDEIVKMCQALDATEAELRSREHAIARIRFQLRGRLRNPARERECGYDSGLGHDVTEQAGEPT